MYPLVRLVKDMVLHFKDPALPILGTHVSTHRCWPQDLDIYMEMNNGRILTILDLGRTILARRVGLLNVISKNRWALTMAGASVRYRKRIKPFVKFKVHSRCVGWDDKFFYLDQSIWIGDECAVQALYRSALTDKRGIVRPGRLIRAMGYEGTRPDLPPWAQNWIDAEATRPWPPQQAADLSTV